MEAGYCIGRDGKEIRNFSHRIKRTVNESWTDDMIGIAGAHKIQNEKLKPDKNDNDTSTTH